MKKLIPSAIILLVALIAGIAVPTLPPTSTTSIGLNSATGRVTLPFEQLPLDAAPALDFARAIDSRIIVANPATQRTLYTTQTHTGTPAYVRNPAAWTGALDLTAASVWNSSGGVEQGGVAISPRHVLIAEHFSGATGSSPMPNGTTLRFITKDNQIVDRTLSTKSRVGSTDLCIGLLSADLPASIRPIPVLSAASATYFSLAGEPVIILDKEEKANVVEISSTSTTVTFAQSLEPTRSSFYEVPAVGDSGNPMLLAIGNMPVLLGVLHTTTGGDFITPNIAAVNTTMGTLGGGYTLTQIAAESLHTPRSVNGTRLAIAGTRGSSITFSSTSAALLVSNPGAGSGIVATGGASAYGGEFYNSGAGPALLARSSAAAFFGVTTGLKIASFNIDDGDNVIEKLAIGSAGELIVNKTITAAGTTGARTINAPFGSVNFAAAAVSLVVTNSLVATSSIIQLTVASHDANTPKVSHTKAAGSFTIFLDPAPAAETRVDFFVAK